MSLEECLQEIEAPRRKEGMRHNLHQMFGMLLISGLCGHFGGQQVARYAKENSNIFKSHLIPIAIEDKTSDSITY